MSDFKRIFVLTSGQAFTLLDNGRQKLVKDKDLTPSTFPSTFDTIYFLFFKSLIAIYKVIVTAFALLPWRLGKVLGLRYLSERAIQAGNLTKAESRAKELLALSEAYKSDFPRGNIIHHGNILLGIIALKQNKIESAKNYLRAAGTTPGSPQLNSFGPNMTLANDLLKIGEKSTVIEYFDLCRKFWQMDFGKLDYWTAQVWAGEFPDFGANLTY